MINVFKSFFCLILFFVFVPGKIVFCAEGHSLLVDPDTASVIQKVKALEKEDIEKAKALLNKRIALKRSPVLLYELAVILSKEGKTEGAISLFREVVKLDNNFEGANKNLGRLLASEGKYSESVKALQEGMKSDGPDFETCGLLGQAYVILGKSFQAEEPLKYALMARPDDWKLLYYLAHSFYGQSRYAESEKVLQSALEIEPLKKELWILLANVRISRGLTGEAIDSLEACLNLGFDVGSKLLWTLGDLYINYNLPDCAAKVYKEAIKKGSPSKNSLQNAASAFLASGDEGNASFFAELLLKDYGDDARAFYTLGRIAIKNKEIDKAKKFFKDASKADPMWGRPLFSLGEIAAMEKDYPLALGYYKSARSIPGFEKEALRSEARILLQNSRLEEALEVLKLLDSKYPDRTVRDLIQEIRLRIKS